MVRRRDMLRLKRHSTDKVSISWKERTSPSKRLVGRGFFYSFLIHFVMLFVFQIRTTYFDSSVASPTPTVFIDSEESSIAVLTDDESVGDDPRQRITNQLHLTNTSIATTIHAVPPSHNQMLSAILPIQDVRRDFLPVFTLPWSLSDELSPSHHNHRTYPVKIILHHDLRELDLTNDGAHLFKKASLDSLFTTPSFSETQPKVEFKIDVSAESGRIIQSTCLRELCDKRLQNIAQQILRSIRFAPSQKPSKEIVSGVLAIQFSGTFETMSALLDTEQSL